MNQNIRSGGIHRWLKVFSLSAALCAVRSAPAHLEISADQESVTLSVRIAATAMVVEKTLELGPAAAWIPLAAPVTIRGGVISISDSLNAKTTYYRLQSLTPAGSAIAAPEGIWTWAPFTNAFCMEGTTTGIGINRSTQSSRVLIYMAAGGACWNEQTCQILNTAVHGPFGDAQFAQLTPALSAAWLFDRTRATNPFRDYSFVYVPYCTGDLHAGSRVTTEGNQVVRHVGYRNMTAFLERLVPTFPAASRVILLGSSVGGMGATFNWAQTQRAFGGIRVDLIDDSGPILAAESVALGKGLLSAEPRAAWDVDSVMASACPECQGAPDALVSVHAAAFPQSRAALLTRTQDAVLSSYYGITPGQFETGLKAVLKARFDPLPNVHYFMASGSGHMFLGAEPTAVSNGTTLLSFLERMLQDDAAWGSVAP